MTLYVTKRKKCDYDDNGDNGIDNSGISGGRVIENTVYYNCTDGINVEGTSSNYVIENNISVSNATGAIINPTPISPPGAYTNNCKRSPRPIGGSENTFRRC